MKVPATKRFAKLPFRQTSQLSTTTQRRQRWLQRQNVHSDYKNKDETLNPHFNANVTDYNNDKIDVDVDNNDDNDEKTSILTTTTSVVTTVSSTITEQTNDNSNLD